MPDPIPAPITTAELKAIRDAYAGYSLRDVPRLIDRLIYVEAELDRLRNELCAMRLKEMDVYGGRADR